MVFEKFRDDFIGFRVLAEEAMTALEAVQLRSRYLALQVSDCLRRGLAIVLPAANQGRNPDGRQAVIAVVVTARLHLAADADDAARLLQEG